VIGLGRRVTTTTPSPRSISRPARSPDGVTRAFPQEQRCRDPAARAGSLLAVYAYGRKSPVSRTHYSSGVWRQQRAARLGGTGLDRGGSKRHGLIGGGATIDRRDAGSRSEAQCAGLMSCSTRYSTFRTTRPWTPCTRSSGVRISVRRAFGSTSKPSLCRTEVVPNVPFAPAAR
jgi:hypothetical protein